MRSDREPQLAELPMTVEVLDRRLDLSGAYRASAALKRGARAFESLSLVRIDARPPGGVGGPQGPRRKPGGLGDRKVPRRDSGRVPSRRESASLKDTSPAVRGLGSKTSPVSGPRHRLLFRS